ncbi:hypothetical protein ACRAKI_13445 [Saccharothrix isguenensis]
MLPGVHERVGELLGDRLGRPVAVRSTAPVTEGWSARHGGYPWVLRCAVDGVGSVVVKTGRPDDHLRAGHATSRESAGLVFLEEVGSDAGPRLLAHEDGLVVLEDLGSGGALEVVLVGGDPGAATRAFVAPARAVGRMQAATRGRQEQFYACLPDVDPLRDRVSLATVPLDRRWATLCAVVAECGLPAPTASAVDDVAEVVEWMAEPGDLLVLTNGDLAPQNCRLDGDLARLLDFEGAQFRHALIDAAQLRLPFHGAPCWSLIPPEAGDQVESAYREEVCAALLDDVAYGSGMAAATAAWTVTRLVRLPELTRTRWVSPAGAAARHPRDGPGRLGRVRLPAWSTRLVPADRYRLQDRWPHLPPTQDVYPAYR